MLADIDLIFSIWVYNNELQIKFTFRSGPMMFGRAMALGLWNLAKYLVVTTFVRYAWRFFRYALIIDLIFGMWVYNDKLQIMFTFRSGPMIFGRVMALGLWNLSKYLVVTTFFSLCLEILTWYLVYECIMMRYRSSLHFVLVQWFLVELWPLDFEIWPNI